MNYNPYVPPQAGPPQAPGPQQVAGPQPWEIGEVISNAWEIYKANWGVYTGAFVVIMICTTVPGMVVNIAAGVTQALSASKAAPDPVSVPSIAAAVLDQAISAFFTIGLSRLALAGARGQPVQFATLFSGGPRFLPYVAAFLLMLFAIVFGFALLIVPGIIVACGLWATPFFIADTELGPIEALKASWEATKGQRLAIFLLALVGMLLQAAGFVACCIGVLVTIPLFLIAQAIVFLRITGRGAALLPPPAPGGYGPPPGAPGGYGPPGGGYGGPPPGYGGPPPGAPPGGYGPPGGGYGGPPPGAPPGGYGPPGGGGFPPR